jgi:hypothetical protein
MSPTPTGRLFGDDLVLTRTFRAPMADVWASLTDPARTARWFGPWQGDAATRSPLTHTPTHHRPNATTRNTAAAARTSPAPQHEPCDTPPAAQPNPDDEAQPGTNTTGTTNFRTDRLPDQRSKTRH